MKTISTSSVSKAAVVLFLTASLSRVAYDYLRLRALKNAKKVAPNSPSIDRKQKVFFPHRHSSSID